MGCECPGLSQRAERARTDHPGRAGIKRGRDPFTAHSSCQILGIRGGGPEPWGGYERVVAWRRVTAVAVLTISVLAANAEEPLAEVTATHLRKKEPASTYHTARGT